MDARLTSEWSILVSPVHPTEASAGAQLACAYAGIAGIIAFWDYDGALGATLVALGFLLLSAAIIFNAIAVVRDSDARVPRYHSIGVINTLIGKTISTGWLRALIVFANVLLVATSVSAFVIGAQLDTAWGCYSGHLPLSRLTDVPCDVNPRPERCWDVTTGRGVAVPCTGTRHANVQSAEWGPIAILLIEWTMVAMLRYKGALRASERKNE